MQLSQSQRTVAPIRISYCASLSQSGFCILVRHGWRWQACCAATLHLTSGSPSSGAVSFPVVPTPKPVRQKFRFLVLPYRHPELISRHHILKISGSIWCVKTSIPSSFVEVCLEPVLSTCRSMLLQTHVPVLVSHATIHIHQIRVHVSCVMFTLAHQARRKSSSLRVRLFVKGDVSVRGGGAYAPSSQALGQHHSLPDVLLHCSAHQHLTNHLRPRFHSNRQWSHQVRMYHPRVNLQCSRNKLR